jgi:hypothetical protein
MKKRYAARNRTELVSVILLCVVTDADQCGVETLRNGTKICSLHKQPLVETTELEQEHPGKPHAEWESSFLCPISEKIITTPDFDHERTNLRTRDCLEPDEYQRDRRSQERNQG